MSGAPSPGLSPGQLDRLSAWLRDQAAADSVTITDQGVLGGGAISRNLALTLDITGGPLAGTHAVVLRTGSASGVSASLGKVQEAAVLRAAFAAGMAAPEPLFIGADPDLLGAPFFIMRRADGVAAGHRVVKADAPQRDLARELGRQLGRLHRVRPGAPGLDFLPLPSPSPALQVTADYRTWLGAAAAADPVWAYGLRWLTLNAPPAGDIVLCHRDYRTGNYLVDHGRLTAVIDWEFAGWSDPMEDLGWFCAASWRFGRHDREAGGLADRADLYDGYEQTSGRPVDAAAVAYWEAAAYLRWAAVAWQQGQRHATGTEPSLELALTGRMLPEIALDLLTHLDHIAPVAAATDNTAPAAAASHSNDADPLHPPPDAAGLIAIALHTYRETVLPVVPADRRFAALMIANALAIAQRQLTENTAAAAPLAAAVAGLLEPAGPATGVADVGLAGLLPRLSGAITAGAFDAADRQAALRPVLHALTRQRLAVSNPRLATAGR